MPQYSSSDPHNVLISDCAKMRPSRLRGAYAPRLLISFQKAIETFSEDPELVASLKALLNYAIEMSSFAHEYDFREVKSNGFRVSVEYVIRLFDYGSKYYKDQRADETYKNMVNLFVAAIPYYKELRDKTRKSKSLIDPSVQILSEAFAEYFTKNGMDAGFGPMTGYYFDAPENKVCYLAYFFISLITPGSLAGSIRAMFDRDFCRDCVRREYNNMTVEHLKWIDLFADNLWVRRISPVLTFGYWRPNIRRTVFVPRQERYKILCDVEKQSCELVQHDSDVRSSETLRCRIQQDTGREPDGTVVMHAHGGGFVMGSADNHESYNRSWPIAMPGVAFFSVDYDLSPEAQFPGMVQQILDAYLFLHTRESRNVIGYQPRRILLIGDSSGGLILTALTCILNDLRKKFNCDQEFNMPIAIIGIYPSFYCVPFTTPSMMLSGIHTELSFPAFLTMISAYVPFMDQNFNNVMRTGYAHDRSSRLSFIWQWLTGRAVVQEQRSDVWWNQSSEMSMKRMQDWKLIKHPYVSPLLYSDFESLSEVKLSVFACATDPILDQSVEICKKWRGEVSLHVWDDVIHAFLTAISAGGKYVAYNDQVIAEIKRLTKYQR